MKHFSFAAFFSLALFAVSGCASGKMMSATAPSGHYAKPAHIVVYDFAGTAADIAADSSLGVTDAAAAPAPTPEDIETGRKLGAMVS